MADPDAWAPIEALYRSDFARFARFARAITGDRETALEAVQEGFADALRKARAVPRNRLARRLGLELRPEPGPKGAAAATAGAAGREPGRRRNRSRSSRPPGGATRATAPRRLPALLRRPRLPRDRRGARDRGRYRLGDAPRSARVAPRRAAGGDSVSSFDLAVPLSMALVPPETEPRRLVRRHSPQSGRAPEEMLARSSAVALALFVVLAAAATRRPTPFSAAITRTRRPVR